MAADAFSYLEDSSNPRTHTWVVAQNDRTVEELEGDRRFQRYYQIALAGQGTIGSEHGAGLITQLGRMSIEREWVYQVAADATHPRGIWRRTPLKGFRARKPEWQMLLDVDALAAKEHQDWTLGYRYISPNGKRCLIQLILGGSHASEWREFDLTERAFVREGFWLPKSDNSRVGWLNDDTLLVNASFGPGTTTKSNLPFLVKEWTRGQVLTHAREIFRGGADDVGVVLPNIEASSGGFDVPGNRPLTIVHYGRVGAETWWQLNSEGRVERMTVPPETTPTLYRDHYVFITKRDWLVGARVWKEGVLSIPVSDITLPAPRVYRVMETDRDTSVLWAGDRTEGGLLLFGAALAKGRLWRARFASERWLVDLVPLPDHGSISQGASDVHSNTAFVYYQSFLQPRALYELDVGRNRATLLDSGLVQFDSSHFMTEQLEARSADGALVPYFVVRAKALKLDGRTPALLLGYGAGGGTQFPLYSGTLGKLWLEHGGIYVVAGIRGGLERGMQWWVTQANRKHTYDDMIAVTEDLIRRRLTSAKRIGVMGYSSGGLLVGVVMTQRPDLYGAAILKAPMLDQFRMDLAMLGADAWVDEFGSLDDPQVRALLERTSPFQNLRRAANFPKPFLITSTTDQTVWPAQPRRFAAKMESLGMPFLFYETSGGGHGLASTPAANARIEALIYTYLARQLLDSHPAKR